MATRAIVISDLHLGGEHPYMMSQPHRLASFLNSLPGRLASDERLELIIAGDFVDFLAIPPRSSWTPDPVQASEKLKLTMTTGPFKQVFDSLSRLIAGGHQLTVLIGNHDVEMTLPSVQATFLHETGATPHQVTFGSDGRAYQIGKVLIEHGNRYDNANMNDWQSLRSIAAALSRNEPVKDSLMISPGSQIVEYIVNAIKYRENGKFGYPFIDLLQPQGEIVALLLVAFEPELSLDWKKIARMFDGQRRERQNREGAQPRESRYIAGSLSNDYVGYSQVDEDDPELADAFGSLYQDLREPKHPIGWQELLEALRDLSAILRQATGESLVTYLDKGIPLPPYRLKQIRVAMRKMLLDENSFKDDGPTAQYGKAARRLRELSKGSVEVVVMGHTHLARHIGPKAHATYINTGTWVDVIRVPSEALEDGADEKLEQFLRDLWQDRRPESIPTYGDFRIERNGEVKRAELCRYHER